MKIMNGIYFEWSPVFAKQTGQFLSDNISWFLMTHLSKISNQTLNLFFSENIDYYFFYGSRNVLCISIMLCCLKFWETHIIYTLFAQSSEPSTTPPNLTTDANMMQTGINVCPIQKCSTSEKLVVWDSRDPLNNNPFKGYQKSKPPGSKTPIYYYK